MLNPWQRIARAIIVSYALVVVGLALSAVLFVSMASRAAGTPVPGENISDTMFPPTDEGRARFGQIFVGEVVAMAGEDTIPTSDPEDALPVILYDVEVEQTLKGEASGRVRIWYEGFEYRGPDAGKVGTLRVGERYLFFAGFDPDKGWYPVNAGLGVLSINSQREATDLVATFEPLIRGAERRSDQLPSVDACEEVGQPLITVEPQQGAVGDTVRLTGTNFVRPEVSIWWDGTKDRLATARVGDDCSIAREMTIPDADPGAHRFIVRDARGQSAEAKITVITK